MYVLKIKRFVLLACTVLLTLACFSQAAETPYLLLSETKSLREGIYNSIEDIRSNQPSYETTFVKKGDEVFYKNQQDSLVLLKPNSIYGYSHGDKIYLSSEGALWRCVNLGSLTHFSEVKISSYINYDPYTNRVYEQKTRELRHNFLDINTGVFKRLNYKNLKPYIDKEPSLNKYLKANKRVKNKELILILKTYNQLNPIYLPSYE